MEGSQQQAKPRSFTFCVHGRVKELVICRECCEGALKQTLVCVRGQGGPERRRLYLRESTVPCEHCAEKRRCRICKGSWICAHGLNKVYCKECDGRRLCQVCKGVSLPRCYEVCKRCKQERQAEADAQAVAKRSKTGLNLCI